MKLIFVFLFIFVAASLAEYEGAVKEVGEPELAENNPQSVEVPKQEWANSKNWVEGAVPCSPRCVLCTLYKCYCAC